jgi:hypothetical protein
VSERGGERKRDQPPNKMTQEEAERLRALLRSTRSADYLNPSDRQWVGKVISEAINRGPPKPIDTKRD